MAKKYHPDCVANLCEYIRRAAEEKSQKVNKACETLINEWEMN